MTEQQNQKETKAPKQELLVLDPFQHQEAELTKLASDYTNYVVTEDNLKEAEAARLKVWRIRVKELGAGLKERLAKIKEFKEDQETKYEKLCNIIQPVEESLEKKIALVKAAKEKREREEKEKEQARLSGHRTKLADLTKLAVKINSMELEDLEKVDTAWVDQYDSQEFKNEFIQAVSAVVLAKTSRQELLELRKKEADRKAKEEAEKAGAKKYDDDFKLLTEMLTKVNLTEDLKEVQIFLEIGTNAKPEAYGINATQAQGVLAALKMLAENREDFLTKRAAEKVTVVPKETPQVEPEATPDLPASMSGYVPNRGAFASGPISTDRDVYFSDIPKEQPTAPNMANHIPDMEEPEVVQANFDASLDEFNVFSYETYKVALSKNVPEKAAKSILNYCEHMLKTK